MSGTLDGSVEEAPASLALAGLIGLAMLSPWAFGAVDPLPRQILASTSLGLAGLAGIWGGRRGGVLLPDVRLWPLGGLLALGVLQLVPLPRPLLRLLAPGSAAGWYPESAGAARLLGGGPHPISLDPAGTAQSLLLACGLVALALLAVPALARADVAIRTGWAVAVPATVLAIYGIVARGRFGPLLYGRLSVPTVSPFGPFVSKNHFAGYVGSAALLALGLCLGLAGRARAREWTRDRTAPGVVLTIVCVLAMALSLLVSQSRGGALAAAGGGAVFAALAWPRLRASRGLLPAAILGLALLGLLAAAVPEGARARVLSVEGAGFRLDTWRDGLRLFVRSPWVGHGFGAFADAYAGVKRGHGAIRVEHAENEYVELLAEGGLLGLGLALFAFALPASRALERLARMEPLRRGLAVGALAGLAAVAVHSAFDFVLRIPSNAALAAVLAAFLANGAGLRGRRLAGAAALGLGLGALVLGLGVAALGSGAFDREAAWKEVRSEADRAASATSPEVRALRVDRATARLRDLLARRPAFAEGWLLLAALRREAGQAEEARGLAEHAAALDPTRAELQASARVLRAP